MPTPKLLFAAVLLLLCGSSCTKIGDIIPVPPPIGVIQSLEQTPFKSYTDSLFALSIVNNVGSVLTSTAVALNDNSQHGTAGEDLGQAEIGYAFRSSVAGAVTSLGVLLPTTGFNHTVTLWDSITGQVLAQTDVPTLNGGKWTFVSLAELGQAVLIQPNHGYIVGFNSLAVGNPVETFNAGNEIYQLDGIYQFFGNGSSDKVPVLPFTQGPVTFENYYLIPYTTSITSPIFPPAVSSGTTPAFDLPGVCDIGFIPAP
jgi:hypothetical protein